MILILGLISSALSSDLKCYPYTCETDSELNADICSRFDSTKYNIDPCKPGYRCDNSHSQTKNGLCTWRANPNHTAPYAVLGAPCHYDIDCKFSHQCNCPDSHSCTRRICTSNSNSCESHTDCNPGKYCDLTTSICRTQLTIGDKGCLNDQYCVNGAMCDKPTNSTGTCKPYLSVVPGGEIARCDTAHHRWLCESAECWALSDKNICGSSLKTKKGEAAVCVSDADCVSEDDIENLRKPRNGTCSCGKGGSGDSYCGLFSGDTVYKEYLSVLQKWYRSDAVNKCNTAARIEIEAADAEVCMAAYWDLKSRTKYFYYKAKVANFASIQEIDDCVKLGLLEEYYYLEKDYLEVEKHSDPNPQPFHPDNGYLVRGVTYITVALIIWI